MLGGLGKKKKIAVAFTLPPWSNKTNMCSAAPKRVCEQRLTR
jgi:hypothetical protein